MKWFKFYGQDWLTDPKIIAMNRIDKLLYLTLLCMASAENKNGLVSRCTDETIIHLAGIEQDPYNDDSDYERAQGFLKRVNDNAMITLDDNGDCVIIAFHKIQGSNLTGYERVKRYREKKATLSHNKHDNTNDNVHDNKHDNVRIDKNRIEDNIRIPNKNKDEEIISVDIGGDFGDIKPLKAVPASKTNPSANPAFSIANMWIEMVSNKLNLKKEEINVTQLFFPINACIKREKFTKEDFKELFTYFLNDKLPDEKKIAYNLCLSANYVAQFNVARKSRGKTNAGISGNIKL